MDKETLDILGFTQEELRDRVVDGIISRLTEGHDSGDGWIEAKFFSKVQEALMEKIDAAVTAVAEKYIAPQIMAHIEQFELQETNTWGEKKGTPITFVEYLTQRADNYMKEEVNNEGKPRGQDGYMWHGKQTRIAHMINHHLHYSIETAMEKALKNANSTIAEGIGKAVKIKLAEVAESISIGVKTK